MPVSFPSSVSTLPAATASAALAPTRTADAAPHFRHWPRRLPRRLAIPATTLWFNLETSARRWPDLPAPDGAALCVRWPQALAAGHRPGPAQAGADDLAMLPYTSGTTGLPKGCMHSHRTLMANAVSGQWMHTSAESVTLAVVPMFHITGMVGGVLGVVYQGATMVILPRWDRELAGRLIARRRITHWTCIPTMVIDLVASPNLRRFDL